MRSTPRRRFTWPFVSVGLLVAQLAVFAAAHLRASWLACLDDQKDAQVQQLLGFSVVPPAYVIAYLVCPVCQTTST